MFILALVKSNSKNKRMFEKEASNQKIKYEVTNFKIDVNNRGEIHRALKVKGIIL